MDQDPSAVAQSAATPIGGPDGYANGGQEYHAEQHHDQHVEHLLSHRIAPPRHLPHAIQGGREGTHEPAGGVAHGHQADNAESDSCPDQLGEDLLTADSGKDPFHRSDQSGLHPRIAVGDLTDHKAGDHQQRQQGQEREVRHTAGEQGPLPVGERLDDRPGEARHPVAAEGAVQSIDCTGNADLDPAQRRSSDSHTPYFARSPRVNGSSGFGGEMTRDSHCH